MSIFTQSVKKSLCLLILLVPCIAMAQVAGVNTNGSSSNAITTAVPFLTISPDSRSGAIGDAGVALSPDVNANYWNPSKLAFLEDKQSVSATYSPWLRALVPDVNLAYLSYGYKVDDRNSIGASVRYFNLGTIDLRDANASDLGTYKPNEFSIDGSFARKFGDKLSLGLTLRYIHSSLANGSFLGSEQTKPGNAVAADISLFSRRTTEQLGKPAIVSYGIDISNIGTKMSYTDQGQKYFLPTNLRLGVADTWMLDNSNELTWVFDINKLLVPTPPLRDANGNIVKGRDDNRSVPSGIFGSFSDAPGGFSEELKEISIGGGAEFWYKKMFALRAGYFYEDPTKGNRNYFTLGTGFKYDMFNLDLSYLIAGQADSPLANTLRFTLTANFGNKK